MEKLETKCISKLQETQSREKQALSNLETAIEESVSSHHERLFNKKKDDIQRRKEIKKPAKPSHLKTVLEELNDTH